MKKKYFSTVAVIFNLKSQTMMLCQCRKMTSIAENLK